MVASRLRSTPAQPAARHAHPWTVRPRVSAALLALAATLAAAPACTVHGVVRDPLPPTPVPAAFAGAPGAEAAPDRWWTVLADPALDELIEGALTDNLQLRAAWAAAAQARAAVGQLGHTFPELTASASAGRQKNRFVLPDPVGEVTVSSNSFALQLGAAYEVDLWRRLGSAQAAVTLDAAAVRDEVEGLAMTVAAELTEAWLDGRAARAEHAVVERQLATSQALLEVLEARFREGLLPSVLDVYQQRSLVAQLRARLVAAGAIQAGAASRLAALTGRAHAELEALLAAAPALLPAVPPLPAVGVPVDLLERRPDLRAARRRVEAADHRVAAAVADRLPALRLQGGLSLSSANLADLVATPLWSLLASATAPLFDNGRRAAAVQQQRAVVGERLARYGQALLVAMVEVEGALAQERHHVALLEQLVVQRELAATTVRAAQDRYREGQIDYLRVLSAQQGELQVELAVIDAARRHLSTRVTLYRALGGTWTRALTPAPLAQPRAAAPTPP